MKDVLLLMQEVAQSSTPGGVVPGGPPRPEQGFEVEHMIRELVQFVGYFLSVGAIGFRYGIVRRMKGMSEQARNILQADRAARLGILGVVLLFISVLGFPYLEAATSNKALTDILPKNLAPLKFRLGALGLALVGFLLVRAKKPAFGWVLAAAGVIAAVLQPLYTGRTAGKVNAVHILAASTWLGTLFVMTVIGIRGMIRRSAPDSDRARIVADLVNAFSPLALVAASVVALSGATTAWLHLKRISALWTTDYGIALVVKLTLVLIVVILGAWNWKKVRPALHEDGTDQHIRRSATMELTFAALVLIATSVLVSLPSPR